jgi:hypothetical protein
MAGVRRLPVVFSLSAGLVLGEKNGLGGIGKLNVQGFELAVKFQVDGLLNVHVAVVIR